MGSRAWNHVRSMCWLISKHFPNIKYQELDCVWTCWFRWISSTQEEPDFNCRPGECFHISVCTVLFEIFFFNGKCSSICPHVKKNKTPKPSSLKQPPYLTLLWVRNMGTDQPGFVLFVLLIKAAQRVFSGEMGWSGGSKMTSLPRLGMAGSLDSARTIDWNGCKWHFYLGGFRVDGHLTWQRRGSRASGLKFLRPMPGNRASFPLFSISQSH